MHEQYARNPNILLALMEMGFSEAIGFGMDKVFEELRREGYHRPKLLDTGSSFIVTLPAKEVKKVIVAPEIERIPGYAELSERQRKALKYIGSVGKINRATYCEKFGIGKSSAHKEIREMVAKEILVPVGKGKATYYILRSK